MIQSSMDERKQKILDGLDAAKKGHEKLKQAEEESKLCLKEVKKQSDSIIANANKQAIKIIDDARTGALNERDEIIKSGYRQLSQNINKVKLELQKQVAELIICGAERILIENISSKNHASIIDKFVKKL